MILEILRMEQTSDQTEGVNWAPRSEVRIDGTPNLETQVEIKAQAEDSEVMEDNGTASDKLEILSIIARR